MFNLFQKKASRPNSVHVDFHSHLLPGLDDGVQTLEQSFRILERFEQLGYTKVITTPHIMSDFYKNSPETILPALDELKSFIGDRLKLEIEAAAEYYLDETFVALLDSDQQLLRVGSDYVLFETSFMSEPVYLKEAIFKIQSRGLKAILAHPERYQYLHNDFDLAKDLFDRGTYFQINLNSLSGYYSKPVKKMAEKLIRNKMVHFFGSDCHTEAHLDAFEQSMRVPVFDELMDLPLLNNTL